LPTHGGDESMWQDEARDLFLGLVLYVLDTPAVPSTLGEVYRTLKTDADLAELIGHWLDTREDLDANCIMSLSNFAHKALKERSGVKSNLTAALNLWANPVIDSATAASDFDLSQARSEAMSVYVGVTLNQLANLSRLLNLFFQQTIDVLTRAVPGRDDNHPVLLVIDEFAALGRMDTLTNALAFLAGYNVRVLIIVQGLGQLDKLYGSGRQDILQNSAVQVYFSANDETTANYISKRLGTKTIRTQSRTDPGGLGWASKSSSWAPRELMLPEEVRQLSSRKEILFKESQRPVLAQKIRYYDDSTFKSRLLPPASVPILDVAQIPPRQFNLPDKPTVAHSASGGNDDSGAEPVKKMEINPDDETQFDEYLGLADELQGLLVNEANETGDASVDAAAGRLKSALGPDPAD